MGRQSRDISVPPHYVANALALAGGIALGLRWGRGHGPSLANDTAGPSARPNSEPVALQTVVREVEGRSRRAVITRLIADVIIASGLLLAVWLIETVVIGPSAELTLASWQKTRELIGVFTQAASGAGISVAILTVAITLMLATRLDPPERTDTTDQLREYSSRRLLARRMVLAVRGGTVILAVTAAFMLAAAEPRVGEGVLAVAAVILTELLLDPVDRTLENQHEDRLRQHERAARAAQLRKRVDRLDKTISERKIATRRTGTPRDLIAGIVVAILRTLSLTVGAVVILVVLTVPGAPPPPLDFTIIALALWGYCSSVTTAIGGAWATSLSPDAHESAARKDWGALSGIEKAGILLWVPAAIGIVVLFLGMATLHGIWGTWEPIAMLTLGLPPLLLILDIVVAQRRGRGPYGWVWQRARVTAQRQADLLAS